MRKIHLLLICCVVLFATSLKAQTTLQTTAELPYIEVTGTAEMEIIPDEIFISITIREREESRQTITIEKQEAELKAAIVKLGIPLENLYLSDANADFIRLSWSKRAVVSQSEYMLKVSDAECLARVFDKLDELKIHDADISKVSHSEIERFRREVKTKAIKAAKEKSDYLLEAIGQETGKAIIVRENNVGQSYYRQSNHSNVVMQEEYSPYTPSKMGTIQFRKIKIKSSIYVKFLIK